MILEAEGLRVLQLSKFFPPVMGGIETVAWELAEGLSRLGVRSDILCSHHAARGRSEFVASGYRVHRVGSLGRVLSTSLAPTMPWHLARLSAGVDLIHVHMPDPTAAASIWMVRPPCPLLVHWHSDVIRQRLALKAYEPLQHWLLARADAIVATSPPYADSSAALAPWRDKVHVVPIGISDHRPVAATAKAQKLRERTMGRRLVFALGRMTYYKGFDVLVEAATHLPEDCVVMIGGDGELLEPLRRDVRRRGLKDRVLLPGHIPDDELPSHFEACDVFCMPSTVRAEAYGVAILEAMVMAKPVVAIDIEGSGVPWVNRHGLTGFNVPAHDPLALANTLRRVLDDEGLQRALGVAGRARYEAEFGAAQMTERIHRLYRALTGIPRRQPL